MGLLHDRLAVALRALPALARSNLQTGRPPPVQTPRLFAPARLVRRAIAESERRNGLDRDGLRRGAGSVRRRIRALRPVDGRPGEAARADLRGKKIERVAAVASQ